jgi:hypothetical protein
MVKFKELKDIFVKLGCNPVIYVEDRTIPLMHLMGRISSHTLNLNTPWEKLVCFIFSKKKLLVKYD